VYRRKGETVYKNILDQRFTIQPFLSFVHLFREATRNCFKMRLVVEKQEKQATSHFLMKTFRLFKPFTLRTKPKVKMIES